MSDATRHNLTMATQIIAIAAAALFVLQTATITDVAIGEQTPPNILLIMTDDQGRWALGAYDERIDTPNLDHLARQGVRFDQAISPVPVCSAARASLMTGRLPSQHGVHDFLSDTDGHLQNWMADEHLLSEALQKQGYRVGLFGKWHASTESWNPAKGFDRWLSYDSRPAGWINQYQHSGLVHFSRDGVPETYTGVQARFLTEEAVRFIDESKDVPFAIFLNFIEPHFPFAGLPERIVKRYRPLARDIVAAGGSSSLHRSNFTTEIVEEHEEQVAQYLAAVTLVDEQVGRISDALEGRKLLGNTVVIFTSDHGHLTGQYGIYGKGNGSFPQNLYQESIEIPFIIDGPAWLVRGGQIRNEFVNLYDLFPTIIEASGGNIENSHYNGPGISLIPYLRGDRSISFRTYQFAEYGNARMIHDGRWKLVRYYHKNPETDPTDHWFDLVHPLGESRPRQPPGLERREAFTSALEAYFSKYENDEHSGRRIWEQPAFNSNEPWRKQEP